jgi:TonB family protein
MPFKPYPLILKINEKDLERAKDSVIQKAEWQKFLKGEAISVQSLIYVITSFLAILLILFISFISSLGEDQVNYIAEFIENIPAFEFKLSRQIISDLKLSNPATSILFFSSMLYLAFAARELLLAQNDFENRFKRSSSISIAVHIVVILFVLIFGLISWKPRPKIKVNTIEFIQTQIESPKAPPPETKRVAPKQSIDQGKNDPKKEISPEKDKPGKPGLPAPSPKASKPSPKPAEVPKAAPKTLPSPKQESSVPKSNLPQLPKPVTVPKPSPRLSEASSRLGIEPIAPTRSLPQAKTYSSSSSSYSSSSSTAPSFPSPKSGISSSGASNSSGLIATLSNIPRSPMGSGGGSASGGSGRGGFGTGGDAGNYGSGANPPPNSYPDRAPSLAARSDVNFGPYMSLLQRKIKAAWNPPPEARSSKIVVQFSLDRSGNIVDLILVEPSANEPANIAAMNAIRRSAPFGKLPEGADDIVSIDFTFDYNMYQIDRMP